MIKYNIIRFLDILCIWFSYFKPCRKVYDFSADSILEIELHQLKRTLRSIKKYHYHEDSNYNIQKIELTLKILEKIIDNELPYDFSKHKCNKEFYININNYKRFIPNISIDNIKNTDFLKVCLYEKKLWYIYNKLRYYYLLDWWE